ncbi:hypothetical protein [Chlamydia sp. 17-3921]|uniref:hypothetical protein n=1 Tax=Chlamydia sp. 17-3921 TaxID=2675798 RepID=UPI00191B89C9|nr:hypothetical protein [Chlamydia sp. 17-3921]
MKRSIYKVILGSLLLMTGLTSCCLNPFKTRRSLKNSGDLNQKSVKLTEKRDLPPVTRSSRRLRRLFSRRSLPKKDKQEVPANFKTYSDHMSDQDKKDISFVVSSVAEKSSLSLAFSQNEIKDALNRIREVHPLALMQALAENPKLVEGIKKMQGRDWIWTMFITQLSQVFSQAVHQGVISEDDIASFSSTLGLDTGTVTSVVHGERWPELVDLVISQPS